VNIKYLELTHTKTKWLWYFYFHCALRFLF